MPDRVLPQLNILLFSPKGQPWELAKAFDTSLPVSEFIGKDVIPDPGNVELVCKVNGELRQKENTNKLICPIPDMIGNSYLYFFAISNHNVNVLSLWHC